MLLRDRMKEHLSKYNVGEIIPLNVYELERIFDVRNPQIYRVLNYLIKHGYIEVPKDEDTGKRVFAKTKILKRTGGKKYI